jgi:hypothetical protein
MSQQLSTTKILKCPGGSYPYVNEVVNCDAYDPFEIEVPANGTIECDIVVPAAKCKAWAMHLAKSPNATATSNLNATVRLNANTTAAPMITLSATNGAGWSAGDPFVNPITVDLTKLFVINPDGQPIIYRHVFGLNESPQSV